MIMLTTNPTIAKGLEKSELLSELSQISFYLLKVPLLQEH
jgi:hypothetical protein